LKGSVIKYRVEGKINPDRIKKLASEGVGLRREDGYGQIAVLGKIQDDMVVSRYRKNDIVEKSDIELTDEDKRVVNMILCNIFKTRSKLQIEKNGNRTAKRCKQTARESSKSNRKAS